MIESLTSWAQTHPTVVAIVAAVAVLWMLVRHARAGFAPQIDPVRLFTAEQKTAAMARCGSRCEAEVFPFVRCRHRASQGDHWYPHSKGGTTNDANLVMLCSDCNRAKAAKIPTGFQTSRLMMRRKVYAPGMPPAGERYH